MTDASGRPVLLIVDDEVRILTSLRRSLRREGFAIHIAESAREALDILADESIDLVLSDQKMPGMSGLELMSEIVATYPSTKRVLITGWTEEIPKAEISRLGLIAILPKPWDEAELKRLLHDQLDS